mgnify:CR=1 FL=1
MVDRSWSGQGAGKTRRAGQRVSSRNGLTNCSRTIIRIKRPRISSTSTPSSSTSLAVGPGEWGYFSLEIGKYPAGQSWPRSKAGLPLPPRARGIVVDAGYSSSQSSPASPIGERYVDINFTDAPSLDCWVNGHVWSEERVSGNVGEALKRIRAELPALF